MIPCRRIAYSPAGGHQEPPNYPRPDFGGDIRGGPPTSHTRYYPHAPHARPRVSSLCPSAGIIDRAQVSAGFPKFQRASADVSGGHLYHFRKGNGWGQWGDKIGGNGYTLGSPRKPSKPYGLQRGTTGHLAP